MNRSPQPSCQNLQQVSLRLSERHQTHSRKKMSSASISSHSLSAAMPKRSDRAAIATVIGLAVLLLQQPAAVSAAGASGLYSRWKECNSQGMYGGLYGAQLLFNLTDFRSNLLSHVWSSFDPSVQYLQGHQRFDPLKPFIQCPPHQPLIRYGNAADGGKLLCDISKLQPPCIIYSLGSNGDYSFEQDALNTTKCEIHTFDCTYNGTSIDPQRHTYHKICVGRAGPLFKTWEQITHELGHKVIDVAQIDIEGHEPAVLAELRHDIPLPRQVVIEIHIRPVNGTTGLAEPAARTPAQTALMFMHMASIGYGVVGKEDNIWGEPGCCAEFTFLHVERHWLGLKALMHELRAEQRGHGLPGLAEERRHTLIASGRRLKHRP